jgi:hypothetical protein
MKLLSLLLLPTTISAFHLSMMNYGNNRSPLAQQYKSITSIHNSMLSAGGVVGGGVRMAPPGEPEPEVSFLFLFVHLVTQFLWDIQWRGGRGSFYITVYFVHGESGVGFAII